MRVVNRTAVTITGAQPFVDWMRDTDADFNAGAITVPRAKAYGSAFLLPEFDLEEDLQEWVEDNVAWLFDFQLSAWTENEETWPEHRDLKTFREWFRIDIHSVVVDVADDDIEGDGVIDLKVGEDVVRSPRSYDTGLSITFPDRAALDAYQTNDRHVAVVQFAAALCAHVVAVDFEI